MPVYIASQAIFEGLGSVPYLWPTLKTLPWLALLWLLKTYLQGAKTLAERNMHGKVVMVTGGTSGIGEAVVRALADRGAQIILLTQHSLVDPFIVEHIQDLRQETNNQLITAEQVDLASLHSIRTFATKWIDNAPPRRLDMIILCANTLSPSSSKIESTLEGVELHWQINYLANFHLLSILSPAIRAQPPDRDVRIVFGTCSSYMGGDLLHIAQPANQKKGDKSAESTRAPTQFSPRNAYATSKLALNTFALAFQKHLNAYKRPDNMPTNTKVLLVDPGLSRTPGTRRWLSSGSLLGLLIYLLTYPFWLLVLKAPEMGAQSFLHVSMEGKFSRGDGGLLVKECQEREFLRKDVHDEALQKKLWECSEQMVQEAEKRGAIERARAKKEATDKEEEDKAVKEMEDYKAKLGKANGKRKEDSRRSRKAG